MDTSQRRQTVAVIGSGLAGLTTAYIFSNDKQNRYDVEILESQNCLSLDSASVDVSAYSNGDGPSRVDVPMRAFADKYYPNLLRLYRHLAVPYQRQRFLYCFARIVPGSIIPQPYMVHSSEFHQIPPPLPQSMSLLRWLWEAIYVGLCYAWFTFCCHHISPAKAGLDSTEGETICQYLRRVRVPQYFTSCYLLPLMSSVCTCSHDDLLDFPASDIITYVRKIGNHYTVSAGVKEVETKLSSGMNIHLQSHVTSVSCQGDRVLIRWQHQNEDGTVKHMEKLYDQVVLAVSPNVVAKIFEPLRRDMEQVPTAAVESVVHTMRNLKPNELHFNSTDAATESIQVASESVAVTTQPILPIDPSSVISQTTLIRTLRNPRSQAILNRLFDEANAEARIGKSWRNGDGHVWLVGGWCWDGMVLLEGCIVSAMRVALTLGLEIPWVHDHDAGAQAQDRRILL